MYSPRTPLSHPFAKIENSMLEKSPEKQKQHYPVLARMLGGKNSEDLQRVLVAHSRKELEEIEERLKNTWEAGIIPELMNEVAKREEHAKRMPETLAA